MLSECPIPTMLSEDPSTMLSEGSLPCSHRVLLEALGRVLSISTLPCSQSRGSYHALRGSYHDLRKAPTVLSEVPTMLSEVPTML